jgi:flagellar hook protein FlgE
MSLFNILQTSVSGMAAQASALSSIGDNIANSGTTGYKEAQTEFQTLLGESSASNYQSGGVITDVRYGISEQGTLTGTASPTDLAVNQGGFFIVSDNNGAQFLTRAGSFVPDSNGYLVNAAGYRLMGYQVNPDGSKSSTLVPVQMQTGAPSFSMSTTGVLAANLPSTDGTAASTKQTGTTPSGAPYNEQTTVNVVDSLGTSEKVTLYFNNVSTAANPNQWTVDAYIAGSSTSLGSATMTFDPQTGALTNLANIPTTTPSTTPTNNLALQMPLSGAYVNLDLTGMTQLATGFGVSTNAVDGNAASQVKSVTINKDGTMIENYVSGLQKNTYDIPLGNVISPDNLTPESGNVYSVSEQSGPLTIATPGTGGVGQIDQSTLEASTVDLATQLTNMITAQRAYEANSKVLQTGSDLLGVLNRISVN